MSDAELPGREALTAVCAAVGLSASRAEMLHERSNAVWRIEDIVVRLAPDTEIRRQRADTVIAVTRWLGQVADSLALAPAPVAQPVVLPGSAVATFWPYMATATAAGYGDVGRLLRQLHKLPVPPFSLPIYTPLHRLREALVTDENREIPALTDGEHAWIRDRATKLVDWFGRTEFPLGVGLVHADAHTENIVGQPGWWRLIDWDQCCCGPRELDLVAMLPDHFHSAPDHRNSLAVSYGYDLRDWPEWTLLRDITELHSLGAYIRLAPTNPAAATELAVRVRSLRNGDDGTVWTAVS